MNQFADCKVYIAEVDSLSQAEAWDFYEFRGTDTYAHFRSNRIQMVVVLAEKGTFSTWDKMPVQAQYRDANLWQPYRAGQKMLSSSKRKPLTASLTVRKLAKQPTSVMISPRELIAIVKEKGIIWCFKRAVNKAIKYLLRYCLSFGRLLRRKTQIAKGKELKGYRYVGKI